MVNEVKHLLRVKRCEKKKKNWIRIPQEDIPYFVIVVESLDMYQALNCPSSMYGQSSKTGEAFVIMNHQFRRALGISLVREIASYNLVGLSYVYQS